MTLTLVSMQNYVYGSGAGLMVSDCPNTQVRPHRRSRLRPDMLHDKQHFLFSNAQAGACRQCCMGPLGFVPRRVCWIEALDLTFDIAYSMRAAACDAMSQL